MTYTPGPWRAHDMESHTIVAGRPGVFVALADARSRGDEENAANARLIAAAPDMLAALKECEEYFDNRADADGDSTGFTPNAEMNMLVVVRAAIAKATSP